MKKKLLLLLVLVIVFLGLGYFNMMQNKVVTYLKVSFNPTLEFGLNENNKVVEVNALNGDAEVLLVGQDYANENIEIVLDDLIEEAIDTGYIKEYEEDNIIEVMTFNDKEETRIEFEERIMNKIESKLSEKRVAAVLSAVKLTDDLKKEALENEISVGKMMLVNQALYLNESLEKENLINMSVKDIQFLIKESLKDSEQEELKKEELIKRKEELKAKIEEKKQLIKEEIKQKIENYESLSSEEREQKLEDEIIKLKSNLNSKKEELKIKIEELKKNNPKLIIPGSIRNAIKNKR